ncbi:hemerythrin domain-containing protein [Accumulibacter sp.]|uniref:hemerythrin domain-containing protein n=1 Tax=Accumulibacter sp. TaxID=2053492 RepID=UPI002639DE39|nr:hemerythrin domain-containing protein [Accumulibacter sp.]
MHEITDLMSRNHRSCDDHLVAVEQAVTRGSWEEATTAFGRFRDALLYHFAAEESLLFPLFEQSTGIFRGPTQVMRGEHLQLRQLLAAAESALAEKDADDYAGTAETLLIMMQQHNVKEENVLYPMCDQQLADRLAELLPELRRQLEEHQEGPPS